jgi:hypothetical protein
LRIDCTICHSGREHCTQCLGLLMRKIKKITAIRVSCTIIVYGDRFTIARKNYFYLVFFISRGGVTLRCFIRRFILRFGRLLHGFATTHRIIIVFACATLSCVMRNPVRVIYTSNRLEFSMPLPLRSNKI